MLRRASGTADVNLLVPLMLSDARKIGVVAGTNEHRKAGHPYGESVSGAERPMNICDICHETTAGIAC